MKEYNGKPLVEGLLEEIKHVYRSDNRPWVIGYSGGKDSTVVVHLVYQMLKNLRPEERHKTVYIVSSDTLVENPLIKIYLCVCSGLSVHEKPHGNCAASGRQ